MSTKISKNLRARVARRVKFRCEYYLISEEDAFLPFHIDHIISTKHGRLTSFSNLAYACPHCNQHKGTDLATFIDSSSDLVRLFDPRGDQWSEHFATDKGSIAGITKIGKATVKLLKLNEHNRLMLRNLLVKAGRYPPIL